MTYRKILDQSRKRKLGVAYSAWIVGVVGIILMKIHPSLEIVSIVAVLVFLAALFLVFFGTRCPKCGGSIGYSINWPPSGLFSMSKKVRFCPLCGVDFDTESEQ